MPYVIPRALAASLFGSQRAQHMQTFAYQDSGAVRTDPIAVSTAETETVTAWLNRNGHQLTRGAGWPEAYLKVVPTDSALRGDAPATRLDATAPASIRGMTCLLPVELARRTIGNTLTRAARQAELVDAGGVRHTVVSVAPGTRAHELLQAWRGRSGHICARPAAIELAVDTCIVQQHGPIDLGDAPGVLHDSRRETPDRKSVV